MSVERATALDVDRPWFESVVADTAFRPCSPDAIHTQLRRQIGFQPEPTDEGLEELAMLLARWLGGEHELEAVARLSAAYRAQPLVQFYALAMQREGGDVQAARETVATLLALDPDDPLAAELAADLGGEKIRVASKEDRLSNIAKLAATPLLRNPYQLSVGAIFESIRDLDAARVLDVGVGSGAQLVELLGLLGEHENRLRRLELVGLDFVDEFLERPGNASRIRGLRAGLRSSTCPCPGESRRSTTGRSSRSEATRGSRPPMRRSRCTRSQLRERYAYEEAREVVRDWLSQGGGQLTCPAEERQECFLNVASWQALLDHAGFRAAPCEQSWLAYAEYGDRASIEGHGTWIATRRYSGWPPITLMPAVPR